MKSQQDVESIRRPSRAQARPLGRKVYAIVNYENVVDPARDRRRLRRDGPGPDGAYYWGVTRYSTSGFLRVKLGDALRERGVAPHIYESAEEARKHLRELGHDGARGAVRR